MTTPNRARCFPILTLLLPALAFTTSCREGIIPASAVMHPTEENLPPPGSPLIRSDTVVEGLSDPERAAQWSAARRALLDATPVTSVGTLDGIGPDLLGTVAGAASDADGNVYILDSAADEVLVFDAMGEFLHRVGGKGEGPEEFQHVEDLVRLPDGRLVVGQWGAQAKVLQPGPDGYTFAGPLVQDRTTEALAIIDMCVLGDRLFVHSSNLALDALVIHEVSTEDGAVERSFADAYLARFASDRSDRSYGRIACGKPATIVWGFYYFPIVRAFRPDNTLLWAALIEDFTQGPVYQNSPSSPTVNPRGSPTEYIVAVHALPPGFVVLQTALYESRGTGEDRAWQVVRWRTYLLDQETGNGGLVSDSLPRIAWIGDSTYVAAWSFPYPRVEVRLMRPGGSSPVPKQFNQHNTHEREEERHDEADDLDDSGARRGRDDPRGTHRPGQLRVARREGTYREGG